MESRENVEMAGSGSSSNSNGSSRWNPTKEQVSMLEGLYMQGIRTPSADQIQQITSRLRVYGHIEGKNVFYWFQNHKARQRQKQKQESMAYFNRFLHKTQSMYPTPCPNVVCGPYYPPQTDLGFYPQYPQVLLPGGFRRRGSTEKTEQNTGIYGDAGYYLTHQEYDTRMPFISHNGNNDGTVIDNKGKNNQETLALFPLQPSDSSLQGTTAVSSLVSTSAENCSTPSSSLETTNGIEEGHGDQPFFDFFSGSQGSSEYDGTLEYWRH